MVYSGKVLKDDRRRLVVIVLRGAVGERES